MANNKSTENLLNESDDNSNPISPQAPPSKPRRTATASKKRNAFGGITGDDNTVAAITVTSKRETESSDASTPRKQLQRQPVRQRNSVTVIDTTADIHTHAPPVPMPRKNLIKSAYAADDPKGIDDIIELSSVSSLEQVDHLRNTSNQQNAMPTISDSSGERSVAVVGDPKTARIFARSRKNTIVEAADATGVTLVQGFRASDTSLSADALTPMKKPFTLIDDPAPLSIDESVSGTASDESNDHTNTDASNGKRLHRFEIVNEVVKQAPQKLPQRNIPSTSVTRPKTRKESPMEMKDRSHSGHMASSKSSRKLEESTDFEYTYEQLIGIYIHETSKLLFDYLIRKPMVRCTILDVRTGNFLIKSDPLRQAVHNYEPVNVDFIQPLISKGCSLKESDCIECVWEELLLINEDINHIATGNEVIFFEIVDMVQVGAGDFLNIASADGWHHICWAFLRPGNGCNFSNIDQRSRLQLYAYKKDGKWRQTRKRLGLYEQWNSTRVHYPGTLDVTVKGIKPKANSHEAVSRPMNALQDDRLNDAISSNVTVSVEEPVEPHTYTTLPSTHQSDHWNDLFSQWKRQPGQSCKLPNTTVGSCQIPASKGSLISQFSRDGQHIALAVVPAEGTVNHNIVILTVPCLKTIKTLRGHTNFVYALNWIGVAMLASASSDRTAIIWSLADGSTSTLYILPHPCFVYAVKVLEPIATEMIVLTGGRDRIMRIWRISLDEGRTDLVQELQAHKNFITSIVCSKKTTNVYTADRGGVIIEWTKTDEILFYQQLRILTSTGINILSMQLHPRGEALYISSGGSVVNAFDVRTGIPLQTFGTSDFSATQLRFSISPCGSLLLTCAGFEIVGWNLLNGRRLSTYSLALQHSHKKRSITSFDFNQVHNFVGVTVYGLAGDAGFYLLGYKSETAPIEHRRSSKSATVQLVKRNTADNEDLSQIIKRIDDIFLLPQNRTDDLKRELPVNGTSKPSRIPIPMPRGSIEMVEIQSSSSDTSSRSGTFTIEAAGIDNDVESVGCETFSVHKKNVDSEGDGTYNVQEENIGSDSDDTCISESL